MMSGHWSSSAVNASIAVAPTPVAGGVETLAHVWVAWVSANDTVSIKVCASGAGNPASQTWRADVWRH